MRAVVTGASGFIGQFLTEKLVGQDCTVYALLRNTASAFPSEVRQIVLDFRDSGWTDRLPDRVDVVLHLAQSRQYRRFPEGFPDLFAINVKATFELLEWSRMQGVKKFVFSSTGNVYKEKKGILKETDPCFPSDMYAATKLCAENLVQQYSKIFCTTICRLFTVYGPRQKNMLIPNLIERVKRQMPITLNQNIGLYLTPIHVKDVCEALFYLSKNASIESGSIFNISGNTLVSLKDIVDLISSLFGKKVDTVVTNGEVKSLCGDSYHTSIFIDTFRDFNKEIKSIINNEYSL